jgi:hypothetical protein
MCLAWTVAVSACDAIPSASLTFDFAGELLPTDVARASVPITNTSSWLPADTRVRLRMSTAAGGLDGPARTAIARAVVSDVVHDALVSLCSEPHPPPAPDAMLAHASLCDPATGRARPFCVGIDRLSVSAFGGASAVVDPMPLAAACGSTDAMTTERRTDHASGFSLATPFPGSFEVPLGPPGPPSRFITFGLTVPRPFPIGVVRAVEMISSPTTSPAEAVLLPGGCRINGPPEPLTDCTFTVALGPWSDTLAPRNVTLAVVLQVMRDGAPRSITLYASTQLRVRAGTLAYTSCRPPFVRGADRVHQLEFSITGGSIYVDGGLVYRNSRSLDPVPSVRVVLPGSPGPSRFDVGTLIVEVLEPSSGPSVFDRRNPHELSLATVDGGMRGSVVEQLREGC